MRLPSQIAVPESRDAITEQVKRLLRAADVNGIIPTPREAILKAARLVESGDLDLELYKDSFRTKASGFFHKAMGKVLGFLDYRSKEVYVDPNIHPSRRNFITFHEVTHKILDWQEVIYTEDEHSTLTPECKNIFESEANYGAADFLFQGETFDEIARDYNIGVASVLDLANQFEASVHATMRRFVERHHQPCLVAILKPTKRELLDGLRSFRRCYTIASTPFLAKYLDPFTQTFLNPGDRLCEILNAGRTDVILVKDFNGKFHQFTIEVFNSGYSLFALMYPLSIKNSRITARFLFPDDGALRLGQNRSRS